MEQLNELLEKYKASEFYVKYKDSYVSDVILRKVFNENIKLHRLYKLKTYSDVHQFNVSVMGDLKNSFADSAQIKDNDILWEMICAFYLDPDSQAIKKLKGIDCSADGLLSIKRIYQKYELLDETIQEYEKYRILPIFFFPQEKNGINMSRASVFGDKIDHTLFDIKNYYLGNIDNCKLANAYKLPKTSKWLKDIESFKNLIEWYGIKGIFVDENYDVYDLDIGDKSIITDYCDKYSWQWSDTYYCN